MAEARDIRTANPKYREQRKPYYNAAPVFLRIHDDESFADAVVQLLERQATEAPHAIMLLMVSRGYKLNPALLKPAHRQRIEKAYAKAEPLPKVQVPDPFEPEHPDVTRAHRQLYRIRRQLDAGRNPQGEPVTKEAADALLKEYENKLKRAEKMHPRQLVKQT